MKKFIWSLLFASSVAIADAPPGYYQSAQGLTGDDLKSALHDIIDGHTVLPYTRSGNDNWHDGIDIDVWEALTYTDSACDDSVPNCGMVKLLYLDESRHISQANRGHGGDLSWDREHVWPKSRGFPKKNQDGYTDLHHLRPADRNLNGAHSNYGYDEGGIKVMDTVAGQKVDSSAKRDKQGESFEPTNQAKGQVARMLFYMAVRYEPGDSGGKELMPDLELKDKNYRVKQAWIGDLCTLIKWNNQYAPMAFERRRNDRVFQIQGNRNPFIDQPGWANMIWENRCSNN